MKAAKNTLKVILVLLGFSAVCSCRFLEVEQIGKSDIEGFFSEPESAQAAINGVMHLTYGVFDRYVLLYSEIASDEVVLSTTDAIWTMYQDFTNTSDDESGALGMIWKNGYQTINNCNQIIEHVPGLKERFPDNAGELDVCMARALFLRALMHHWLCLCYGQNYSYTPDASHLGVTVVDRTLSLSEIPSRASVADVYSRITADLERSLTLYPEGLAFDRYFPGPLASKALLARVCLYKGDWAGAEKYAAEVLAAPFNGSPDGLVSRGNYFNMFYTHNDIPDDECIFRINGYKQGRTCYNMFWAKEPSARPSLRVSGLLQESDDIRGSLVSDSLYGSVCKKHDCGDFSSTDEIYKNHPILRMSEMYLIRAEASLHRSDVAQAAKDIETLRSRACGHSVKLSEEEKADMDLTVAQERIRELCFEGHRLWDITRRHEALVRTADNSSSVKRLEYPDYRFVLPIPSVELEANRNIEPNPDHNE